MSEQSPQTITSTLVVQLIQQIESLRTDVKEVRREVDSLKASMVRATEQRREFSHDLQCLSDGVKQFKEKFEPYLDESLKSRDEWRKTRRGVIEKVLGSAALGLCLFTLYSWRDRITSWFRLP